jgi:opacity protein-like surface antigen
MFNRSLLATLLLSALLHAKDDFSSERFLGIEAGYGEIQSKNVIGVPYSTKGVEFGFRFGAQNEEWRTTLSAHHFNKNSQEYFRTMLTFDHFVWSSLYKADDIIFKPYIGAHVGWLTYEDKSGVDDDGFIYGGQAGIAWNVLREVDFDFGYRYSISDINKVDDIGSVVFAVNYLY